MEQDELVIEAYRKWAPRISAHHEDAFHVIERALTQQTLDKYVTRFEKDASILDIGGGDGLWSIYLAKKGFKDILMADISPDLVTIARENATREGVDTNISFKVLDVEKMDMPSQCDLIISPGCVLSHCLNYQKALENIYASLLNNGIFIFTVDSFYEAKLTAQYVDDEKELENLLQKGISKHFFNLKLPYHTKYFRYEELERALLDRGFRILQVHSRPQMTEFDLKKRFQSPEEIKETLEKEARLIGRKELLNYGYQLEFVVNKQAQSK